MFVLHRDCDCGLWNVIVMRIHFTTNTAACCCAIGIRIKNQSLSDVKMQIISATDGGGFTCACAVHARQCLVQQLTILRLMFAWLHWLYVTRSHVVGLLTHKHLILSTHTTQLCRSHLQHPNKVSKVSRFLES